VTNTAELKHEDFVVNYPDYHVEWYVNGSKKGKKNKRIIDMCLFPVNSCLGKAGEYEVMYMTGECETLDEYHTFDWGEACGAYARMVRTYCPQSWKNLIESLKAAKTIAKAATCDDGGTCNFDSPALSIPEGMKYEHVKACCAAAGVRCFDWKPLGTGPKLAVLSSCAGNGQGNRRTKGAEAACKFLNERGYNCGMYYQMD
jgi:hypothetical protein